LSIYVITYIKINFKKLLDTLADALLTKAIRSMTLPTQPGYEILPIKKLTGCQDSLAGQDKERDFFP
jgi:hypothetical protein